jgi:hypothetical protein
MPSTVTVIVEINHGASQMSPRSLCLESQFFHIPHSELILAEST